MRCLVESSRRVVFGPVDEISLRTPRRIRIASISTYRTGARRRSSGDRRFRIPPFTRQQRAFTWRTAGKPVREYIEKATGSIEAIDRLTRERHPDHRAANPEDSLERGVATPPARRTLWREAANI